MLCVDGRTLCSDLKNDLVKFSNSLIRERLWYDQGLSKALIGNFHSSRNSYSHEIRKVLRNLIAKNNTEYNSLASVAAEGEENLNPMMTGWRISQSNQTIFLP
ncbi:MAG: hypothetical protein ACREOZ_00925 [Gloeomargaritales cyanobacterium]